MNLSSTKITLSINESIINKRKRIQFFDSAEYEIKKFNDPTNILFKPSILKNPINIIENQLNNFILI